MKYNIQIFIKNKLFVCLYVIYIVITFVYQLHCLSSYNSDVIASFSQLRITLSGSIFHFIFYFVLSYEYSRKAKENEIATKNKFYLYNLLIFIILDLVLTVICSAFNIGAFLSLGLQHNEFIVHILINIFINIFGISLLGIIMGFCFSQIFNKRLISYIILILFAFLSSRFFEQIVELVYNNFYIDLYPIYNVFKNLFS